MQWKSAIVISSVFAAAALAAQGCGPSGVKTDGGTDAKSDSPIVSPDGSKDTGPKTDAPTGTCPQTDPSCENCDTTSYVPLAQGTPTGPNPKSCQTADVTAFVNACFTVAGGSQTACTAWQTAEQTSAAACLACVFSEQTAATWGALVCTSAGCSLNVPGCLDVALNQKSQENATSTGSCGDFLSASYGCQDAACQTCTTTDFTTCVNDALADECKSYGDAFSNATSCASLNGDVEPPNVSKCFAANNTTGYTTAELNTFTNYMCGQ